MNISLREIIEAITPAAVAPQPTVAATVAATAPVAATVATAATTRSSGLGRMSGRHSYYDLHEVRFTCA